MANCTSVRLDLALLVNTTVGDEVQLPHGPSLKLVRRADNCAVFQVLKPKLSFNYPKYCHWHDRVKVGLKLSSLGWEQQ